MKAQCFNKDWQLHHGLMTVLSALMPTAGDSDETVTLPHDVMISSKRAADTRAGAAMGYFEGEECGYKKTFTVPSSEKNLVHYVHFDGVYMNADIKLNGRWITKHGCGYTPFTVQIDRYLKYDEPNELQVVIFGSALPNARWYPGLGIYRDVTFYAANRLHIPVQGIHVTTVDCDFEFAVLSVEAEIANKDVPGRDGYIMFAVKDADGTVVAEEKSRFYVDGNDKIVVRKRIEIESPKLWNVDTPNLYTVECEIIENGETVDADMTTFGIRKIQLDSRHGMRINGVSVKLKGGCIHHDNAMLGAVSLPDAEMRKIAKMKEGGYNAVRTAHNPPSQALLDACDKLGMFVMDEFTDVWPEKKAAYDYGHFFPEHWEEDVEDMVRRDYNHPSVIMWSIGNEIPETGDLVSDTWGRKLVDKFHALDPYRPVTNGINVMMSCLPKMGEIMAQIMGERAQKLSGGINDLMSADVGADSEGTNNMMQMFGESDIPPMMTEEAADMLDLVGYNYTADLYERQHEKHPQRVFFGSETRPQDLDYNWNIVKKFDYVIGDFCWTGWDYLGEVGIGGIELAEDASGSFMGKFPWICAYDADFDLIGNRRTMSYWRDTVWTGRGHQPYIGVTRPDHYGKDLKYGNWAFTDTKHSWSWPGFEGQKLGIEVYSDAEEAELIVNGKSLGKKKVGDGEKYQFYNIWETEYQPGEVTAVTYIGGQEVGRQVLKTVAASALCVSADKTVLRAGSQDLSYVEISLADAEGTVDMTDTKSVKIEAEGAVILAGSGSADPKTTEMYQDTEHKFYEGKVLAIVKAGEEAGAGKVTVTCEGLAPVVVDIEVK